MTETEEFRPDDPSPSQLKKRRQNRTRLKIANAQKQLHRLSIFRSSKHIYAQVIDDKKGVTLAAASSIEKSEKKALVSGSNINAATHIGKLLAERAILCGIKTVIFDRGSFKYHGRVKALAESARESGLKF